MVGHFGFNGVSGVLDTGYDGNMDGGIVLVWGMFWRGLWLRFYDMTTDAVMRF